MIILFVAIFYFYYILSCKPSGDLPETGFVCFQIQEVVKICLALICYLLSNMRKTTAYNMKGVCQNMSWFLDNKVISRIEY